MPVMTYKKIYASWAAVVCVFNLNTKEGGTGSQMDFSVRGQPSLLGKFHDSQG